MKLTFEFDHHVVNRSFGFIHAWDEAFPNWWSDRQGRFITAWAGGPAADALLKRTAGESEAIALQSLEKILGQRVASRLVACHTHNWALDPHVRGGYSYIPVNGLDLPKLLAAPLEGTLFFAGEATVTDGQTGTVASALKTGHRAANELLTGDAR
jgi:monoamine oxidase